MRRDQARCYRRVAERDGARGSVGAVGYERRGWEMLGTLCNARVATATDAVYNARSMCSKAPRVLC